MIHSRFIRPQKKSDRAEYYIYHCKIDECPLLEKNECIHAGLLSRCVYGGLEIVKGPTKRSKKFYDFQKNCPKSPRTTLRPPTTQCMEYVGNYVWLPYPHMTMCESVPFKEHSHLFLSGLPFLPKENFNIDTIKTLVKFRPQALFGGEITSYQKHVIPIFLYHLKHYHPELFDQLDKSISERVLRVTSAYFPKSISVTPEILDCVSKLREICHIKITQEGKLFGYEGQFYIKGHKDSVLFLEEEGIKVEVDVTKKEVSIHNINDDLAAELAKINPKMIRTP